MEHILIADSDYSRPLFNALLYTGERVTDVLYHHPDIDSRIMLEYYIEKKLKLSTTDLHFHFVLDHVLFQELDKSTPTGVLFYYYSILRQRKVSDSKKIYFSFYSALVLEAHCSKIPIAQYDLTHNQFNQLPLKNQSWHKSVTASKNEFFYLANLYRGKEVLKSRGSYSIPRMVDKYFLIIDDEYSQLQECYESILNNKTVGFTLEEIKNILSGKTTTSLTVDINQIKGIISDVYLTELHKDMPSNLLNAKDLSGIVFQNKIQEDIPKLKELPLLFLTSSTRIWNFNEFSKFKNFRAWIPKPSSEDVLKDADLIIKNFELFHNEILAII